MENRDLEYFDKLWQDSMPKDGMKHTKETWDNFAKTWKADPPEVQNAKDESVRQITKYLLDKGVINPNAVVIDIGCGTGNYTVEFAKHAKEVYASDISELMLGHVRNAASEAGVSNISYIETDFLNFDTSAAGWDKKFDLVFTSLTPAMSGLDSVRKVNSISKGYCFNNSFVYRNDTLRAAVMENVFSRKTDNKWGNSSPYCLFNILWQMGYQPEMSYYKEVIKFDYELTDAFVKNCVKNIIRDREPNEDELKRVRTYLESIAKDGMVHKETKSLFAWTLWKV